MVVCYPLRHGPVIEAIAGQERVEPGDVVEVHITSTQSDRKLRGRIVKIISNWKGYRESITFASIQAENLNAGSKQASPD